MGNRKDPVPCVGMLVCWANFYYAPSHLVTRSNPSKERFMQIHPALPSGATVCLLITNTRCYLFQCHRHTTTLKYLGVNT